jgi:hypothetical protein
MVVSAIMAVKSVYQDGVLLPFKEHEEVENRRRTAGRGGPGRRRSSQLCRLH